MISIEFSLICWSLVETLKGKVFFCFRERAEVNIGGTSGTAGEPADPVPLQGRSCPLPTAGNLDPPTLHPPLYPSP